MANPERVEIAKGAEAIAEWRRMHRRDQLGKELRPDEPSQKLFG